MYSAYSGDEDVLIASQCGMKERISKPTDIQKLEYLVNKYLLWIIYIYTYMYSLNNLFYSNAKWD